jgi:hypothetical protein
MSQMGADRIEPFAFIRVIRGKQVCGDRILAEEPESRDSPTPLPVA